MESTADREPPTSWGEAMQRALYGPGGFWTTADPRDHFRTSVHASPLFARALARLLVHLDEELGHPARLDLVDMGAGRGELASAVREALPEEVRARLRATAVELRPRRPAELHEDIDWRAAAPERIEGLVIANEWLDNIPLEIAERDPSGRLRRVLVDAEGREHRGGPLTAAEEEWAARWWPGTGEEGERVELGTAREPAWQQVRQALSRGLALAVDYGHLAGARPPFGTLGGFRAGRACRPVPDGSCDLTAHVALDALAGPGAVLLDQRTALGLLGVSGHRPEREQAVRDPQGYLRALAGAGEAAELTARGGLGDFHWLLQPAGGVRLPLLSGARRLTD